jgi:uncharacterized membrane protein
MFGCIRGWGGQFATWWPGQGLWGGSMMIGIFVLIAVGVFFLARWLPKREGDGDDSRDILKRRYARGEISRNDFEAMCKTLDERS